MKKYYLQKTKTNKRFYGSCIRVIIAVLLTLFMIVFSFQDNYFARMDSTIPVPVMVVIIFISMSVMIHAFLFMVYEYWILILSKFEGIFIKICVIVGTITILSIIMPYVSMGISNFPIPFFVLMLALVVYDFVGSFYRVGTLKTTSDDNNLDGDSITDDFINSLVSQKKDSDDSQQ